MAQNKKNMNTQTENTVSNLTALREQEQKLLAEIASTEQKYNEQLVAALNALPEQFGVASITDFLALIHTTLKIETPTRGPGRPSSVSRTNAVSSPPSRKRKYRSWQGGKGRRLSKDERTSMFGELKLVIDGKRKVKQVAKQYKVSRQTVYNMLRKLEEQGKPAA